MEFRWLALITLWTLLIGPVLDRPAKVDPTQAAQRVNARMVRR